MLYELSDCRKSLGLLGVDCHCGQTKLNMSSSQNTNATAHQETLDSVQRVDQEHDEGKQSRAGISNKTPERVEHVSPVKYQVENSLRKYDNDDEQGRKMDDYLLNTLDEMETRTEALRETVKDAEIERLRMLESLNTLLQSQALENVAAGERDELELYIDRLTNRLLTINISVQIIRDPPQEESLQIVRTLLRKLQHNMKQAETDSGMIHRYLNSCMEEANGPVDDRFQEALLGCAVEDQKEVKKKLTDMLEANDDLDRQIAVLASIELT